MTARKTVPAKENTAKLYHGFTAGYSALQDLLGLESPPKQSAEQLLPYTIGIDARKIQDFGIGTYVRNLVRSLAAIDAENRYVLLAKPGDREGLLDLPENFQVVLGAPPADSLRELAALSWQLYRRQLDLYHLTHYVLPAWVGAKVVVTIHDIIHLLYPEFLPSNLAFLYAHRMIRRSLHRGDCIVAVSHNTKNDLMHHFEVDGRKIEVIHNGVEEIFRHRLPASGLCSAGCATWGCPSPTCCSWATRPSRTRTWTPSCRPTPGPGRMAQFDAPLICVGSRQGSEFKIRQRAEYLGIGDKVRLLGHVAQEALPAIYQGASLFLYPTLYEGFGLPVVEAMASGVPVITSNTSALKEIAEGYAHLVVPLDLDGMAKAIAHLMGSPETRETLAASRRAPSQELRLGARSAADARRLPLGHRRPAAFIPTRPGGGGMIPFPFPPPQPAPARPRVALVHDWLTGMRGGEKVIEALGALLPGGPPPHSLPRPRQRQPCHRVASHPDQLPAAGAGHPPPLPATISRSFLPPLRSLTWAGFDVVLSSSHCVAKGVIPPPGAFHLCYCHTPMRYAWDQEHAYFPKRRGVGPRLRSLALTGLRAWDVSSAARVNLFVANSRFVAKRIETYYGRPAEVIHPPVDVGFFTPAGESEQAESGNRGYCLMVSALAPYKKVELAMAACEKLGLELRVVGQGPEYKRLAGDGRRRRCDPLPGQSLRR